jgi:hypothetical protein
MKTALVLVALITSFTFAVNGQNALSGQITWSSTSAINLRTNEKFAENCSFVTQGSTSIDWIQKEGAKIYNFNIKDFNGVTVLNDNRKVLKATRYHYAK